MGVGMTCFLGASRHEVPSVRKLTDRDFTCQRPCSLLGARLKLAAIGGALISVLLGSNLVPAEAGTEVLGQPDALQFRAEHASTSEVLAALAASFKLTYKLPPNIDRELNFQYSGSLRGLLARILDGTDHFVRNSGDGIDVIVLRASGSSSMSVNAVSSNAIAPKLTASLPPPPLASYLKDN
jgi:hypothetical protein